MLNLWSDRTLGYKTQHGFGAIIESLTALNNNQPLNQLSASLNMSSSSNNQYILARGLTITCPTVTHPLRNHRGDGPYTTPEEVRGSSMVVSPVRATLPSALNVMNASSVGKLVQLVTASRLILYHEGRIDPMKDECHYQVRH